MAAVRRGSDSGVYAALVVLVVLALTGLGCGIWFYHQFSIAKEAYAETQGDFKQIVHAVFNQNNWDLPTQEPPQKGVTYVEESFVKVAEKLELAAEYEAQVVPTLGWESLAGMQDALKTSPVQREKEAEGEPTFTQLSHLLEFYEGRYESLTDEARSLRRANADLSSRAESANAQLVKTTKDLGDKLNQAVEKFRNDLAKLRGDYNELLKGYEQLQLTATDWQQKYQNEVNERKRQVAQLEDELRKWQRRYGELVRGPGEREQLVPAGKVTLIDTENDFIYIEGGEDKGFRQDDVCVVFRRAPDGTDYKKAVIAIGDVYDSVSRATVMKEDALMLEGDYFVSFEVWEHFYGAETALPG